MESSKQDPADQPIPDPNREEVGLEEHPVTEFPAAYRKFRAGELSAEEMDELAKKVALPATRKELRQTMEWLARELKRYHDRGHGRS